MNERIETNLGDRYYGQLAPAQAARTNFTPGKANAPASEQEWPTDFRIPVGTPNVDVAGPRSMVRTRVVKLGRGTVCDQVLQGVPVAGDPDGNTTLENDGRFERNAGNDRPAV